MSARNGLMPSLTSNVIWSPMASELVEPARTNASDTSASREGKCA
jgi:hypothetical protein